MGASVAHTGFTVRPGVSLSFPQTLLAVTRLGQNKTLGGLQKMIDSNAGSVGDRVWTAVGPQSHDGERFMFSRKHFINHQSCMRLSVNVRVLFEFLKTLLLFFRSRSFPDTVSEGCNNCALCSLFNSNFHLIVSFYSCTLKTFIKLITQHIDNTGKTKAVITHNLTTHW